jgi:hypothetical protein
VSDWSLATAFGFAELVAIMGVDSAKGSTYSGNLSMGGRLALSMLRVSILTAGQAAQIRYGKEIGKGNWNEGHRETMPLEREQDLRRR